MQQVQQWLACSPSALGPQSMCTALATNWFTASAPFFSQSHDHLAIQQGSLCFLPYCNPHMYTLYHDASISCLKGANTQPALALPSSELQPTHLQSLQVVADMHFVGA